MAQNVLLKGYMPVPLPLHYETRLVRTPSSRAQLEPQPTSSEHMLLSSIGLCLLTTFEAFAARERIEVVSYEARVGGTVDTTETGLAFTKFQVEIEMEVSNVARARATLDEAQRLCLISNALRAPVVVDAKIRPPVVRKVG